MFIGLEMMLRVTILKSPRICYNEWLELGVLYSFLIDHTNDIGAFPMDSFVPTIRFSEFN